MALTGLRVAGLLFGAPDSGSFVAAGARGLRDGCAQAGCELELQYCESRDAAERIVVLRSLAECGADLIVVHGGQGDAPLAAVAPRFPAQRFVLAQGQFSAPNVMRYTVLLEQPAYRAGALAAWWSRSGTVAHLSGERVGPGLLGEAAFRAGALHARADIRVLSHFCGDQHSPGLAERAVLAHARAGADVVFTMLGAGRSGAIDACRASGMRQIGDGIDWCALVPDVFLASAVADVGWCGAQAVLDARQQRWRGGGASQVGLERPDICRLAVGAEVSPELQAQVEVLMHLA